MTHRERQRAGQIGKRLVNWFGTHARDLPWRKPNAGGRVGRDAYRTLVAEFMLQQTQVERVVDKFKMFIKRFPSVRRLAEADEQDVLAAWQGLGYYRRARNLHETARIIVREFGGRVPSRFEQLEQLPGIGRYTAGAITSIAFDKPDEIVDGNVYRVLSRLDGAAHPPDTGAGKDWAWQRAQELVSRQESPGQFNEALMELGATVCTPRSPSCHICPLRRFCKAAREGLTDRLPVRRTRSVKRCEYHYVVIVSRGQEVYVQQRGEHGLWSCMWQQPTVESDAPLTRRQLRTRLGLSIAGLRLRRRESFTHQTTHIEIEFIVYEVAMSETAAKVGRLEMNGSAMNGRWVRRHDLTNLPMSNPQRRILEVCRER